MSTRILFTAALMLCSSLAHAKLFRNAYVSFELPPNWSCQMDGTEWICTRDLDKGQRKDAIIILTAKERGPNDTLAAYAGHLKTTRTIQPKGGAPLTSKVIHVRDRKISDWDWVDAMHLGSEIGPYYTRYLATVKDRIAVLVTFSAHKLVFTRYSNDFLKAIESLRVVATKDLLEKSPGLVRPSTETIGAPIGSAMPSDLVLDEYPDENSGGLSGQLTNILALLLVIVALAAYFLLVKKKKRPKQNPQQQQQRPQNPPKK